MSGQTNQPENSQPRKIDACGSLVDFAIVFSVSAITFLVERWFDYSGLIEIPEAATGATAVIAGFITAISLIFIRRQSLSEIGFRRPKRWSTVPLWVIGILVIYIIAEITLPAIIGTFIEIPSPDLSRYDSLHHNLPAAIAMVLVLPLTASIPEEVIYRGFLMDRLTRVFGRSGIGNFLTVFVQALIFGAIHFQWGVGGMFVTTIMGAIWGTAFLLCGRNLWIVILAHSGGHVLMIVQLYFVKASEMAAN